MAENGWKIVGWDKNPQRDWAELPRINGRHYYKPDKKDKPLGVFMLLTTEYKYKDSHENLSMQRNNFKIKEKKESRSVVLNAGF